MGKFRFSEKEREEFINSHTYVGLNKLRSTLIHIIAEKKEAQRKMRKVDPTFELNSRAKSIGLDFSSLIAEARDKYK